MKIGLIWRLVWGYVGLLLLLVLIALLIPSCGTRKTAIKVEDSKTKVEEKSTSEGSVTKETTKSEENSSTDKASNTDEKLVKRIEELYNENGTLKSRLITLEKAKMTNSKDSQRKSLRSEINRVDSIFNTTNYKNIVITTHVKDKKVDADKSFVTNVGGWGMVIGIAVIVVGAIFLYFYLRRT